MKEMNEKTKWSRIVFFDADKTIWQTVPSTYASEGYKKGISRTFSLNLEGQVVRKEDGAAFILKEGVIETFQKLSKEGIGIGMISDNILEDVQKVAELFGIWKLFDSKLINIRLWDGDSEKGLMIHEVFASQALDHSTQVLLVDDNPVFASQMEKTGYSFIQSPMDAFPKDLILAFFGIK